MTIERAWKGPFWTIAGFFLTVIVLGAGIIAGYTKTSLAGEVNSKEIEVLKAKTANDHDSIIEIKGDVKRVDEKVQTVTAQLTTLQAQQQNTNLLLGQILDKLGNERSTN